MTFVYGAVVFRNFFLFSNAIEYCASFRRRDDKRENICDSCARLRPTLFYPANFYRNYLFVRLRLVIMKYTVILGSLGTKMYQVPRISSRCTRRPIHTSRSRSTRNFKCTRNLERSTPSRPKKKDPNRRSVCASHGPRGATRIDNHALRRAKTRSRNQGGQGWGSKRGSFN